VHACVRACVRACLCTYMHARAHTHARMHARALSLTQPVRDDVIVVVGLCENAWREARCLHQTSQFNGALSSAVRAPNGGARAGTSEWCN